MNKLLLDPGEICIGYNCKAPVADQRSLRGDKRKNSDQRYYMADEQTNCCTAAESEYV